MKYSSTQLDGLKKLFDRQRLIIESDYNRLNEKKWGVGVRPLGLFRVYLGSAYYSRVLGVDLRKYYFDPFLYLETNLRLSQFKFEKFPDDTPLTKAIPWHPGVTMEPSLFGAKTIYHENKDPWESHGLHIINDYSDLASVQTPDFYKSDAMKYMHSMYEQMQEIVAAVAPDFSVSFPNWWRSPFAVACSMRGMENLFCDFIDEPDFVHELMAFATNARIEWDKARFAFTGEKIGMKLGNDEVNCQVISPRQFQEFIFPYEQKMLEYYGTCEYYHSCGDLTPLFPYIKTLDPRMVNISPWTDLDIACETFSDTETVLEIWANLVDDVMLATAEHTRSVVAECAKKCNEAGVYGYIFCSGNIQRFAQSESEDNEKILNWVNACRSLQ